MVLFLSNYENISSLPNRSNISLMLLSYYLTAYPGMLNNKHYSQMRLLHLGDVELNPGPNKSSSLSFLHWNINRIAAHDFSKLALIQSHAASHNTDIIFLSETFLDSTTEVNDPKINIPGYNLLRCNHPSNLKRAGVCMFYKEYLPINRHDDLCTLTECIVTELNLGKKSVFFTLSYRSPSQTTDETEVYSQNLNLTLTNVDALSPFCHVLIGDFNARSSSWWTGDITTRVGRESEALTSTSGYSQLIDKPTHFFNGGSSCIDLIFCNKPEFVLEYGIDHSLFQTCHPIMFAKISAKFALPPDYEREVWDHKKANIDGIQKSISLFNWERAFNNLSNNEKVDILNSTLLNIFRNYNLNKIVKCSYKDPPWIIKLIKSKLKHKSKLTTKYYKKGQDPIVFDKLMNVSRESTEFILNSKMNYIKNKSNILNDKKTDPKVYWTVLNYFLNFLFILFIYSLFTIGKNYIV